MTESPLLTLLKRSAIERKLNDPANRVVSGGAVEPMPAEPSLHKSPFPTDRADPELKQTVVALLGEKAYDEVYSPLPMVPHMVESVGTTAENMLRRGATPAEVIQRFKGAVGRDTILK